MADVIQRERTIRVKIVYYGPALGGKTTNLRLLHGRAISTRRGELISINSMQDRTILFDLLPMNTVGPHGYDIRVQLFAVPGQVHYAATRRAALKGADGVVFVANSAADRREENLKSYGELVTHLSDQGIDPSAIPLVLQYNKRDLPQVMSVAALDAILRKRAEPAYPAVAPRGEGVIETFEAILERTLRDLARRYRALAMEGQGPREWAQRAVATLFGRLGPELVTLAQTAPEAHGDFGIPVEFELDGSRCAPGAGTRTIRVPMTDAVATSPGRARPAGPRTTDSGSGAQAAAELATALSDVTAQRDRAWERLAQVRGALARAAEVSRLEPGARPGRMLAWFGRITSATRASFVFLRGPACGPSLTVPAQPADPLLSGQCGQRYLRALAEGGGPRVVELANDLTLWDLLSAEEPRLAALISLPVQAADRLVGLVLLQIPEGGSLPSEETLQHLGLLAALFALPLEAAPRAEAHVQGEAAQPVQEVSAAARR